MMAGIQKHDLSQFYKWDWCVLCHGAGWTDSASRLRMRQCLLLPHIGSRLIRLGKQKKKKREWLCRIKQQSTQLLKLTKYILFCNDLKRAQGDSGCYGLPELKANTDFKVSMTVLKYFIWDSHHTRLTRYTLNSSLWGDAQISSLFFGQSATWRG